MSDEKQRELFEAWKGPQFLSRNNTPGSDLSGYQDHHTQTLWAAWRDRAAIAAQNHTEQHLRMVKLIADVERCYQMLLSEPDTKGALFKAENILRAALDDARESQSKCEPVRLTNEQIDAGIKAWFETHITTNDGKDRGHPFRQRMRAAIESAVLKANGIGGE